MEKSYPGYVYKTTNTSSDDPPSYHEAVSENQNKQIPISGIQSQPVPVHQSYPIYQPSAPIGPPQPGIPVYNPPVVYGPSNVQPALMGYAAMPACPSGFEAIITSSFWSMYYDLQLCQTEMNFYLSAGTGQGATSYHIQTHLEFCTQLLSHYECNLNGTKISQMHLDDRIYTISAPLGQVFGYIEVEVGWLSRLLLKMKDRNQQVLFEINLTPYSRSATEVEFHVFGQELLGVAPFNIYARPRSLTSYQVEVEIPQTMSPTVKILLFHAMVLVYISVKRRRGR